MMLCQICGKNPASVHFTEIHDNKMSEIHVCERCAEEKGMHTPAQQRPELELERLVALRAAEPPGFLERGVEQTAARALDPPDPLLLGVRHRVGHPGDDIRDVEFRLGAGALPGVLQTFLLGAAVTHVDLRHLVVVDLGEVDRRRVLAADLAQHLTPPRR